MPLRNPGEPGQIRSWLRANRSCKQLNTARVKHELAQYQVTKVKKLGID